MNSFAIPEGGNETAKTIAIGDYFIIETMSGYVWIEHSSGEGMELTPEMVDKFYKDNF